MFNQLVRYQHHQTIILWVLLAVLILPMVLFFKSGQWRGGGGGQGPGGTAGIIFGHKIPWEQFERERQLVRRSLEARLGGTKSEPLPDVFEPYVREQTWDRLLLQEEAKRTVKVNDSDVAAYLQQQPTFQNKGRFDRDLYFRYVRAIGFTPRAFEDDIRNDLRIQRLMDRIKAETVIRDEDLRAGYSADHDRLRAGLVVIDPKSLEAEMSAGIQDADLIEYYARHLEAVQIPQQRTIEYVGLSAEEARAAVPDPDEPTIKAFYDDHQDEFKDAQGAVKPVDQVRDAIRGRIKEEAAAKRLKSFALDLQEDLDSKLPFADIVAKRQLTSKSTGTVERTSNGVPGGPSGTMISEAFDIGVGSTTSVFDTADGVYLLRAATDTPPRVPPYEEVSGRVRQLFVADRGREAARARAQQAHDELAALLAAGRSFDDAAAVVGVPVKHPEPFDRQGPQDLIGYASGAFGPLFDLQPGHLSEPFETPQGWTVAFVQERLPFDNAQFEKDKESFRAQYREMKEQEHVLEWLDTLRERARLKSFLPETTPPTPPGTSPVTQPH